MNEYQVRALAAAQADIEVSEMMLQTGYYGQAVSRAYYAMFYCATALLESRQLNFSKHHAVIGAFGREFALTGQVKKELHRYIIDAEEDRCKADYDIMLNLPKETAQKHLDRARLFLAEAQRYLTEG